VGRWLEDGKSAHWGKHRTGVTEATERELACGQKASVDRWLEDGESTALGKASHGGGTGVVGKGLWEKVSSGPRSPCWPINCR
jgi:hypothetical protein